MVQLNSKNLRSFESLVEVVKALRGPDGCPWDKEQTHQSLTRYAIEEAYELAEAIDRNDKNAIKEELGDLLFQSLLHAEIAGQNNDFNIFDVIESLNNKMVNRHPHVFANTTVSSSAEVVNNWHKLKEKEKETTKQATNNFNLPVDLPALIKSQKIGSKTKSENFSELK